MLSTYLIILTTTTLLWSATAKPSPRQTCVVSSYGDVTKSDVPAIKRAFKTCGNGGIIRFTNGITYSINDFLSIEGCKGCEVQLDGTLKQSDNITHWQTQYVTHPFQNSRLSIVIQGAKDMLLHSPSGKGLIDGNAQAWWDTYHTNSSLLRPILLTIANSTHVTLDGIKMINSPMWFNFIVASSYINFLDTTIQAKSTSDAIIANTDGFDTYQSDNVVIRGLDFDAGLFALCGLHLLTAKKGMTVCLSSLTPPILLSRMLFVVAPMAFPLEVSLNTQGYMTLWRTYTSTMLASSIALTVLIRKTVSDSRPGQVVNMATEKFTTLPTTISRSVEWTSLLWLTLAT